MEYKYSNSYDLTVKKIDNGFVVQTSNPDTAGVPQMFFADELEAYEFAALEIAKVIEELKK